MSTSCHLLLLVCTSATALSCAGRPEYARGRGVSAELHRAATGPSLTDSQLAALRPAAAIADPYAPIRAGQTDTYVWQNHERVQCPPPSQAEKPDAAHLPAPALGNVLSAVPERTAVTEGFAQSTPPAIAPELVIARLKPALHHCFARWLDGQADAQGSVYLSLELGCAGEVESISAHSKGVDPSALSCLFSAVAPARFSAPQAGHAALSVPIVFKNLAR